MNYMLLFSSDIMCSSTSRQTKKSLTHSAWWQETLCLCWWGVQDWVSGLSKHAGGDTGWPYMFAVHERENGGDDDGHQVLLTDQRQKRNWLLDGSRKWVLRNQEADRQTNRQTHMITEIGNVEKTGYSLHLLFFFFFLLQNIFNYSLTEITLTFRWYKESCRQSQRYWQCFPKFYCHRSPFLQEWLWPHAAYR